jgi:hypothetical protein
MLGSIYCPNRFGPRIQTLRNRYEQHIKFVDAALLTLCVGGETTVWFLRETQHVHSECRTTTSGDKKASSLVKLSLQRHFNARRIEELRNQSSEQNTPVATPPEQAGPCAPATGPDLLRDNTDAQEAAQEAQTARNPKVRSLPNNPITSFVILICTGGPEKKAGRQRYYRP